MPGPSERKSSSLIFATRSVFAAPSTCRLLEVAEACEQAEDVVELIAAKRQPHVLPHEPQVVTVTTFAALIALAAPSRTRRRTIRDRRPPLVLLPLPSLSAYESTPATHSSGCRSGSH